MISLLLTLFISLFNLCPTNIALDGQELDNNVTVLSKSAFEEDNNEGGMYYVYTQSDLMTFDCLQSFISFFGRNNITINDYTSYVLRIKPLQIGIWNDFDYAAGYDYRIHEIATFNYVNIYKVTYDDYIYYQVYFSIDINNSANKWFGYRYCTARDFDYMLSVCYESVGLGLNNYSLVALYGDTSDLQLYEALWDILHLDDRHSDFDVGYANGYNVGYNSGYDQGVATGYQAGYNAGLDTLDDYNTTANTIFQGVFDIGLLPVNVFLTIFNFEFFGVNIAGVVSGLLTLSVVIIIVRMLLGGKKDD